jgi:hypothetical protein
MANTLIQIKFSDSNSAPTLLNVAEPAYSYVSNTLFIGTTDDAGAIIIGGKAYVDKTNSAFDKANSANVLAQAAYNASNTKFASTGGTVSGNITITGNIIPSVANTYFLGSAAAPFHSLFVGPGSINIGGVILTTSNGSLGVNSINIAGVVLSNSNGSLGITTTTGNPLDFSAISNTANSAFVQANAAFAAANTAANATSSINGGSF